MKQGRRFGYGYYFKCIDQALKKRMDDSLMEVDLTKSQEEILRFLHFHRHESIIQKDIENFFHISNPTVTGLLNRLESKGFITRELSKEDKRVRTIKLTTNGKAVQEKMKRNFKMYEIQMTEGFSDGEKEMLYELLERVIHNLEQEDNNA